MLFALCLDFIQRLSCDLFSIQNQKFSHRNKQEKVIGGNQPCTGRSSPTVSLAAVLRLVVVVVAAVVVVALSVAVLSQPLLQQSLVCHRLRQHAPAVIRRMGAFGHLRIFHTLRVQQRVSLVSSHHSPTGES